MLREVFSVLNYISCDSNPLSNKRYLRLVFICVAQETGIFLWLSMALALIFKDHFGVTNFTGLSSQEYTVKGKIKKSKEISISEVEEYL